MNKLYKCECKKTEFTEEGEILIGFFEESGDFKGVTFLRWKENWSFGDAITFTREEFGKIVKHTKEI